MSVDSRNYFNVYTRVYEVDLYTQVYVQKFRIEADACFKVLFPTAIGIKQSLQQSLRINNGTKPPTSHTKPREMAMNVLHSTRRTNSLSICCTDSD